MKLKIDKKLVPIKAHFFFFFAALGPILPQLNVFGRQLGVSPAAMGLVTAVLPLLWALAKPTFGYVVDFWPAHRKLVFMLLITIMSGSYCCLWFLPMPEAPYMPDSEPSIVEYVYKLNDTIYLKKIHNTSVNNLEKYKCHWNCSRDVKFDVYLTNVTFINTIYVDVNVRNDSCSLFHMDLDGVREGEVVCVPKNGCNLLCYEDESLTDEIIKNVTSVNRNKRATNDETKNSNGNHIPKDVDKRLKDGNNQSTKIIDNHSVVDKINDSHIIKKDDEFDHHIAIDITKDNLTAKDARSKVKLPPRSGEDAMVEEGSIYMTPIFWGFVVLMCVGTVAFNVANCIGDAICFDVLGSDGGTKYGAQRAWGTAGYGLTALAGGWLVDAVSTSAYKDFTPAFVIALVATAVDLYSCRTLTLPSLSSPEDSGKALREILRIPRVLVFITFAVVAGTFDSFIIYYMFWFLEELAEVTGHTRRIKLIEGVIIAGQSFVGEMLFFYFSGKIIKRWGFGTTLSFSLLCYGVRMVLISFITNPWHLVFVESVMQGPTYALCYSSIVGYAAHVAPPGYSATVQGIVAGMDDGLGFALGSLVGGQLYARLGGRGAFRLFAGVAVGGAVLHAVLFTLVTRRDDKVTEPNIVLEEDEKMLPERLTTAIYRDTVEPVKEGDRDSDEPMSSLGSPGGSGRGSWWTL